MGYDRVDCMCGPGCNRRVCFISGKDRDEKFVTLISPMKDRRGCTSDQAEVRREKDIDGVIYVENGWGHKRW